MNPTVSKRESKLESIDRERGDCIVIYLKEANNILSVLDPEDKQKAIWYFVQWVFDWDFTEPEDSYATRAYHSLRNMQMEQVKRCVQGLERKRDAAIEREKKKKENRRV